MYFYYILCDSCLLQKVKEDNNVVYVFAFDLYDFMLLEQVNSSNH